MPSRRAVSLLTILVAACSLGDPAEPRLVVAPEEPPPQPLSRRLRRLGGRELAASVHDLTGVDVPYDRLGPLRRHGTYDNGDPDTWVTSDVLAAVEEISWLVADEVVRTHPARVFAGCDRAETCKQQLLDVVVPRIFRRPLSVEETTSYGGLWDETAAADFLEGVRSVIAAAIGSPAFLYRSEIGGGPPEAATADLDPRELATELAFLVTGTTPDDELLAVAADQRLLDPTERLAQVARLAKTPAARSLEGHFLDLYLATSAADQVTKSSEAYPGFDPRPLTADFRAMLDGVVEAGGSSEVLLRHEHPLPDALRGRSPDHPPVRGVLMHPAFLATHGGFEHSNPIARGVFVLANLLCAPPPPPPPGIPRVPSGEATSPGATTRERFAAHTAGGCQACHARIDGIGFGFEQFDGAGRFRSTENGAPIDPSGRVTVGAETVAYAGVDELASRLAKSREVAECFGRHFARFAFGGGERVEDIPAYRAVARSDPGTTYDERVRRLVASDAFTKRRKP